MNVLGIHGFPLLYPHFPLYLLSGTCCLSEIRKKTDCVDQRPLALAWPDGFGRRGSRGGLHQLFHRPRWRYKDLVERERFGNQVSNKKYKHTVPCGKLSAILFRFLVFTGPGHVYAPKLLNQLQIWRLTVLLKVCSRYTIFTRCSQGLLYAELVHHEAQNDPVSFYTYHLERDQPRVSNLIWLSLGHSVSFGADAIVTPKA